MSDKFYQINNKICTKNCVVNKSKKIVKSNELWYFEL